MNSRRKLKHGRCRHINLDEKWVSVFAHPGSREVIGRAKINSDTQGIIATVSITDSNSKRAISDAFNGRRGYSISGTWKGRAE